jgi:multicomponent Na+:H+ antiporter subunit C
VSGTAPNLTLVVVIVVLTAGGVYLLLERSLTRIVLGLILFGNAANLLLLVAGGAAGRPPIVRGPDDPPSETLADPLAQAMVLTAIVITLGLTAFLLAMSYRSWQLHRHDEVADDVEDRRIARLAARDRPTVRGADTDDGVDLDSEAAETHDETDEGPPESPTARTGPAASGPEPPTPDEVP